MSASPVVCKQSDIFALGCICHELLSGSKVFGSDFHVFEYMTNKCLPRTFECEITDQSSRTFHSQIVHSMLEIDWWARPSTDDILKGLAFLIERSRNDVECLSDINAKRLHCGASKIADLTVLRWKPHW